MLRLFPPSIRRYVQARDAGSYECQVKKTRGFPRKNNNRYIKSVFEFQVSTVPKKMHFFNLAVVGESHARIFFFFRSIEHFPYKKRKILLFQTVKMGTDSPLYV